MQVDFAGKSFTGKKIKIFTDDISTELYGSGKCSGFWGLKNLRNAS